MFKNPSQAVEGTEEREGEKRCPPVARHQEELVHSQEEGGKVSAVGKALGSWG